MRLADVDLTQREIARGWLGSGRDKAEDDDSWGQCDFCEGVGFSEAEAFMCVNDKPEPCPECKGTGRR